MRYVLIFACAVGLLHFRSSAATTQPLSEHDKIEALIRIVQNLKDASFIRNGQAYDGKAAADHMRQKLDYAGKNVKTARDFIRLAASSSSVSGKPYLIRFKDGTEIKSADFLLNQLEHLEHPTTQPATAPS